MRSRQIACLVFALAAIAFGGTARGDVVAQYSFTGSTIDEIRIPTTVAPNVTAGTIIGAPPVNNQPVVTLVRTVDQLYPMEPVLSAQRAPFNESIDPENVYFTFSVSANVDHELDLSNLTFNVARGGAATPRNYDVRTSLNGVDFTSLTGVVEINTVRPTFTSVSVDLSGAQFQDLSSPLTFRIHFYSPDFTQNVDFDDITVNGLVASVSPGLTGDYNGDGSVDAADYVEWRRNNINGQQGYDDWRANFGNALPGSGSGSLASAVAAPEPTAWLLAAMALGAVGVSRRRQ